jgi:hypothetical protein
MTKTAMESTVTNIEDDLILFRCALTWNRSLGDSMRVNENLNCTPTTTQKATTVTAVTLPYKLYNILNRFSVSFPASNVASFCQFQPDKSNYRYVLIYAFGVHRPSCLLQPQPLPVPPEGRQHHYFPLTGHA